MQVPMKDGDFEATLGQLKGQSSERSNCLSKSRVKLHSLPYACPGSAG